MFDLLFGIGIEDSETGVNVPFLGVDSEGKVDLNVLNSTDVAGYFPGELGVGVPGLAHGEEGGVGHGLGVCCDAVVLDSGEVHLRGVQAGEDLLDLFETLFRRSVIDDDLFGYCKRSHLSGDFQLNLPRAGHWDQQLGRGGNGSRQCLRQVANAFRKQQSQELCKRFAHQQWRSAW